MDQCSGDKTLRMTMKIDCRHLSILQTFQSIASAEKPDYTFITSFIIPTCDLSSS